MILTFSDMGTHHKLVKLTKKLFRNDIPIIVITLPFGTKKNFTEKDVAQLSISKSTIIFTMSDTDVIRDFLKKVACCTQIHTK